MKTEQPIEKLSQTHYAINKELCQAVANLGAGRGLLCILGSWGDTLPESEILTMLVEYNKVSGQPQRPPDPHRAAGS